MEKRNVYIAASITALICGIILMLMFIFGFSVPLPLPEEKGVVIEVGGGGGGGMEEILKDDYAQLTENKSKATTEDNYVTQNTENVDYVASDKKKVSDKKVNVETPKPTVDSRVQNFKWGQGGGSGSGSGTGSGTGEGSGSGTGIGSGSGSGAGNGNGTSFNLKGRSAKSIPKPSYTEDDQGKVVVTIKVNKNGEVTFAEPGANGTTTSNRELWKKAKEAALRAKFSVDQDAPEEQRGTITYTFIKLS